jgi:hypothetical protein
MAAPRLELQLECISEGGRNDYCCLYFTLFEFDGVVHTAHGARPSSTQRADDDVAFARHFLDDFKRGRLRVMDPAPRHQFLDAMPREQLLTQRLEDDVGLLLGVIV